MQTAFLAFSTALLATATAVPALADNDWRDRHEWRDDRQDQSRAYREGYRDGLRADARRDAYRGERHGGPVAWQPYGNGSRWDSPPRDETRYSRSDVRFDRYGNAYPVYRNTSASRQPYWWGANGQVQCRRQDGTTGLIVGALAGGTLGNVIAREGDKRLGSVIGGTLGAVLGNEIAKGNARCR